MGFDSVYRVLRDLFPKVDSRVLRAVAIEHLQDADAAVEVVIKEVMPFLSTQKLLEASSVENCSLPTPDEATKAANSTVQKYDSLPCASGANDIDANGANVGVRDDSCNNQISSSKVGSNLSPLIYENGSFDDTDKSDEGLVCKKNILSQRCQETSCEEDVKVLDELSRNDCLHADTENLNGHVDNSTVHEEQLSLDGKPFEMMYPASPAQNCITVAENNLHTEAVPFMPATVVEGPVLSGSFITVSNKDLSSSGIGCGNESMMHMAVAPKTPVMDVEKQEQNDFCRAASEKGLSTSEMDDLEVGNTFTSIVRTQSSQICSIELLADIIENARSEKITLRTAKDSVISLMKEVELKEKSVEQAKEEAARGGLGILQKVEELQQMLQRAKEANDMNAGEVSAEKAILATEARELQSRLLSLSDERNKALAILDEMRQLLVIRLNKAEKEIKLAEQERLEREESAQKALAYEESVMEKVVLNSKMLEQEAEENAKLREFLMDRGRVVDTIQGEISVLCQDVKLMKEKISQQVPQSISSSSQTTSDLASSSPSLGMESQQVPELVLVSSIPSFIDAESQQVPELVVSPQKSKASASTSFSTDDQLSCGDEMVKDHKDLIDDEWELFDNNELSI